MIIREQPPLHLTYCLNIHKGETWAENFAAIREKALAVRDRVAQGKRFGLGLRLSNQAARELNVPGALREAREFFEANGLYAFTINGFPYGQFHAGRVKENVYQPDWRTAERRNYTLTLAHILAQLLPEGVDGSISTVPCSFKAWITTQADVDAMVGHLVDCAKVLHKIHEHSGKEIHLGLEPEPSCYLETTEETVRFFNETLFPAGGKKLSAALGCSAGEAEKILRRHVGVCFDTCHVAIQFEDLAESLRRYEVAGIRVSKIQVSAALRGPCNAASLEALAPFAEPVYFHQVKGRDRSGAILSWDDLPEALRELPTRAEIEELRVHFHVPLFVEEYGALSSTGSALTPEFFAQLRKGQTSHLEIETYTFDVLPEGMRTGGVEESIAAEYGWLLAKSGL
ncbi:MAG: metabolite traffic protein EboE [Chthoniobacteraceae bacterium]